MGFLKKIGKGIKAGFTNNAGAVIGRAVTGKKLFVSPRQNLGTTFKQGLIGKTAVVAATFGGKGLAGMKPPAATSAKGSPDLKGLFQKGISRIKPNTLNTLAKGITSGQKLMSPSNVVKEDNSLISGFNPMIPRSDGKPVLFVEQLFLILGGFLILILLLFKK